MRVLAITNMYPSARTPRAGTFIEQQVEGLRRIGLDVDVLLVDRAGYGPLQYARTGSDLRRALSRSSWDVLHVMYGGVMADLATRVGARPPTVVSFCGVDLLGADYGPWWYQLRTRAGVHASHRAAGRADAIIVKSRNLEEGLPSGIDRSRVSVLPNGICLTRFQPMNQQECRDQLGWRRDVFHVLFSTANPTSLKKRYSLAKATLAELSRGGLTVELHGLSNLPHDQVPVWINASDVLLFTSMSDEGSPNIVKECLACNRPVVSVDSGDVAERIEAIEGCHLVEATPSALAGALLQVYSGPRIVQARERMQGLSIEVTARRLQGVYSKTIRSHDVCDHTVNPGSGLGVCNGG